jgi:hypothetical protein
MPFRPLQRFNGLLDRMAPQDNYGGLLSPQDQHAAAQAYRAQLASSLLSAAGPQRMPVSLGQALGSAIPQAMQVRDQRAEAGLRNEQLRRQIERDTKQNEAMGKMRGLLGAMNPENAEMIGGLFDIAPGAVAQGLLGQMFAQNQPASYESPIGKLLGDRDIAARRGDTEGVAAIESALKGELGSKADLGEVLRIRNDVTRNSAQFLEAQTGYKKVLAAASTDSPAGDMSLIFGFMKVLDPGSIVKEGEFATVQNSAGVPEQVRGMYNRIMRGERLTPEQRQDFLYQARAQYVPLIEQQQRLVRDTESFAQRNSLPFKDLVPEFVMPILPEPIAPAERRVGADAPSLFEQIKRDASELLNGNPVPPLPPGFTLDPE